CIITRRHVMRTLSLLVTTALLGAGVTPLVSALAQNTAAVIASSSTQEVRDGSLAARNFLEHVNYARVALAMKDVPKAKEQVAAAGASLVALKADAGEERRAMRVESGRMQYDYESEYKDYYFPMAEVKTLKSGPLWTRKGIAVTDAEIVYLDIDLKDDKA